MQRRHVIAALGGTAWSVRAQTAGRSFAVLSEFARDVNIVTFQSDTGTRLGANQRNRIPIANGAFDRLALGAVKESIDKAEPGARLWLIAPADTNFMDSTDSFVEGSTVRLPDDLAAALKERGSTHLLTVTPLRGEASLKSGSGLLGNGALEGIGYYVDLETPMKNMDTLALTTGFIAPYVYLRVTLIDVSTRKVLGMRRIVEGEVLASEDPSRGHAWNVMTTDEKLRVLSAMVRRLVGENVRQLVAAR